MACRREICQKSTARVWFLKYSVVSAILTSGRSRHCRCGLHLSVGVFFPKIEQKRETVYCIPAIMHGIIAPLPSSRIPT